MPCIASPAPGSRRVRTDDLYISLILTHRLNHGVRDGIYNDSGSLPQADHQRLWQLDAWPPRLSLGRDCAPATQVRPDRRGTGEA